MNKDGKGVEKKEGVIHYTIEYNVLCKIKAIIIVILFPCATVSKVHIEPLCE